MIKCGFKDTGIKWNMKPFFCSPILTWKVVQQTSPIKDPSPGSCVFSFAHGCYGVFQWYLYYVLEYPWYSRSLYMASHSWLSEITSSFYFSHLWNACAYQQSGQTVVVSWLETSVHSRSSYGFYPVSKIFNFCWWKIPLKPLHLKLRGGILVGFVQRSMPLLILLLESCYGTNLWILVICVLVRDWC